MTPEDERRLLQHYSLTEDSHNSHEVALAVLLQLAIHKLDKDTTSSNIANTALAFFFCRFGKVHAARAVSRETTL